MKRWINRAFLAVVTLTVLLVAGGWLWLRASLPLLDGEHEFRGLSAPASISRDALGVATVRASNELDLARATGFLHAQERFFQMDLLRRSAAGEVAALVGEAAVDYDRGRRIHDLRNVARRVVSEGSAADRELLGAYAEGVNEGLAALGTRPFEYGLLRVRPMPWKPEDAVLVVFAMYFDLHDEDARRERYLASLHEVFPPEFVEFLVPPGTDWDAPIIGDAFPLVPIPGSEVIDFRDREDVHPQTNVPEIESPQPGSNSWAVSGALSASGVPIVANDMHLGHGVPNIWFRLRLELDAPGGFEVTGVSLPGTPAIVAGSNGHVSWSFTNSYGDWIDLVRLEVEGCPNGYLTLTGCEALEIVSSPIKVANGETVAFEFTRSKWGPVLESPINGHDVMFGLQWTAHFPEATNLRVHDLARARNIEDALAIAQQAGIPPQNFIVADSNGRIAWSIMGRIPRRVGHNGRRPLDSSSTVDVWDGWRTPDEYPLVVDPGSGRLWSANARMVDGEALQVLGHGGYSLGARAMQIRDRLHERQQFDAQAMLDIQLDDEARFLARWHGLLSRLLADDANLDVIGREDLRGAITNWEGRASIDAIAYRLVRAWRDEVMKAVFGAYTAEVMSEFPGFGFGAFTQSEGPLWQLVTEQPPHLLPAGEDTWDGLMLAAADRVILAADDVASYRWGQRNMTRIDHPLGQLPLLGLVLNAGRTELPGDLHMPRVQAPGFGASQRFAVSPGRESEGYFHMPGGQSGHPLSRFYLSAHRDWEQGVASSFLPGPTEHVLALRPATEAKQ